MPRKWFCWCVEKIFLSFLNARIFFFIFLFIFLTQEIFIEVLQEKKYFQEKKNLVVRKIKLFSNSIKKHIIALKKRVCDVT